MGAINNTGISFYHMKDHFLVGASYSGKLLKEKFSSEQIYPIIRFVNEGVFDDMFENVDVNQYMQILGLQFESLSSRVEGTSALKQLREDEEMIKNQLVEKSQQSASVVK